MVHRLLTVGSSRESYAARVIGEGRRPRFIDQAGRTCSAVTNAAPTVYSIRGFARVSL